MGLSDILQYTVGAAGGSVVAIAAAAKLWEKIIDNRLEQQTQIAVARFTALLTIETQRDNIAYGHILPKKFELLLQLRSNIVGTKSWMELGGSLTNPYRTKENNTLTSDKYKLAEHIMKQTSELDAKIDEASYFIEDEALIKNLETYARDYKDLLRPFNPLMQVAFIEEDRPALTKHWDQRRAEIMERYPTLYEKIRSQLKQEINANSKSEIEKT